MYKFTFGFVAALLFMFLVSPDSLQQLAHNSRDLPRIAVGFAVVWVCVLGLALLTSKVFSLIWAMWLSMMLDLQKSRAEGIRIMEAVR